MKIGLFFGSFNPIHVGHLIIANYLVDETDLDEIWFVVSPQNPHKKKASLLSEYDRLHLVELAIKGNHRFKTSNIEFKMPQPSYTSDTLNLLNEKYPKHAFTLIMGGDNLASFPKWKNYETILKYHSIYVYNRPSDDTKAVIEHERIRLFEAPMMHVSASFVRNRIKAGQSIQYIVPDRCIEYLEQINAYQ